MSHTHEPFEEVHHESFEEIPAEGFEELAPMGPPEPFEEVPPLPPSFGRETAPMLPLRQALQSATLDPARMYEMQDRRAAKTTTGSFTVKHEELFYNVMAIGASGLGKTTLLRNLFQGYAAATQLPRAGKRSYATIDEFLANPDAHTWDPFRVIDESTCKSVQVKVVDMPGFGYELDMPHKEYVRKIMEFVLQQKAKDYPTYTSKAFPADIMGKLRSTLSVCVYFLTPYKMHPLDLVLIAALSKEVPVVPVMAMADAMSPAMRLDYAQHIMRQLSQPKRVMPHWSPEGPVEVIPITGEDKERLGVDADRLLPPFAVMGSEDVAVEEDDGREYCPVIHTMAGSLEVMNRQFCDTILLKRFLMGDGCYGFWNILSAATNRYLSFCERVESMTDRRMEKKVVRIAEEISHMCQIIQPDNSHRIPSPAAPQPPAASKQLPPSPTKLPTPSPTLDRRPKPKASCTRSCALYRGLMPVLKVLLLVLMMFGVFLAGVRHAEHAKPQHGHSMGSLTPQVSFKSQQPGLGSKQAPLQLQAGTDISGLEEVGNNAYLGKSGQADVMVVSENECQANEPSSSSGLTGVRLPSSEALAGWTENAVAWAKNIHKPKVLKRSRLFASKVMHAAWGKVEVAAQRVKCKVGWEREGGGKVAGTCSE